MFTKEYQLIQHTMLIHFQAGHTDGTNVCLRASEVKPKLDRFLVKKMKHTLKESWIQSRHTNKIDIALKYRMTIKASEVKLVNVNEIPKIFYGNMDPNNEEKKNAVIFPEGVSVKIICMIPELLNEIDHVIGEFFAVTNFGTMQDKGFGSFTVKSTSIENICKALSENFDVKTYYVVDVRTGGCSSQAQNELFDTVKQIYSIMKSGQNFVGRDGRTIANKYIRSFIYQYMHETHHLGNEKAWLKKQGIAPIRTTHEPRNTHEHHQQADLQEFRYVRALLGVGEQMTWAEPEREQKGDRIRREKITIKDITETNTISRYASPIFFKIIGSRIYITANQPDKRIFDHEFKFANQGYIKGNDESPRKEKKEYISTLTKDEGSSFDMADFLNKFMEYYNGNLAKGKLRKRYRMEAKR